ncbi:MAG: hypothetical protein NXH99_24020 [Rhodobacteraceae bacterium]|nr:hypothetical protein [Paracoccaceae bacterium]
MYSDLEGYFDSIVSEVDNILAEIPDVSSVKIFVGKAKGIPGIGIGVYERSTDEDSLIFRGIAAVSGGNLIATVQTLNISQKLTGALLGGKVALSLVHAVRHWANTRGCAHVMVHVTNGENAENAHWIFRRSGPVTIR